MNPEVRQAIDREWAKIRRMIQNPQSRETVRAVIALPPQFVARILTEKRNELLGILRRRRVRSVSELAQLTGRRVESVSRDLKILSRWGFIRYERHGKCKSPKPMARYVVIPVGQRASDARQDRRHFIPHRYSRRGL